MVHHCLLKENGVLSFSVGNGKDWRGVGCHLLLGHQDQEVRNQFMVIVYMPCISTLKYIPQ